MEFRTDKEFAKEFDKNDPLSHTRELFHMPHTKSGSPYLYFAGHSLGVMPKKAKDYIGEELEDWAEFGVEGHFDARHPWLPYHENLTKMQAHIVGAKESEVVTMNTLTVNLHLMMVSFYRPSKTRYKILIENNTFPSDKYAVDSQAKFHGFDPSDTIVELCPRPGELTVDPEQVLETIDKLGDELALVMLGNCNYLSGQYFDIEAITKKAHEKGALAGFNLAHGAGNLKLDLHKHNVDFAVWCGYKYLNSGPGGLAAAFVHENHAAGDLPRFCGWWGHDKESRFKMGPDFKGIEGAQGWQLSNPPIFQLASLRSSLEIFYENTMDRIVEKGHQITNYMEYLFESKLADKAQVISPSGSRGSMLCLRFKNNPKKLLEVFKDENVICDFREPDILRMTPAPLYNTYSEVHKLVEIIEEHTS
ncbi:MAG: kynureninase [Bacteriovoracaceae bacterium]|nr:kynureninase [Bacteriovoracaceae bacterium]